jgi:hypothetical protein
MKKTILSALSPLAFLAASCGSQAQPEQAMEQAGAVEQRDGFTITDLARFDSPWALAFLPGRPDVLVTERTGALKLWRPGGKAVVVAGTPKVDAGGQGGLGDVAVAPDFARSGLVYLTWAEAGPGDTRGAALGRARLVLDQGAPRLENLTVIWRQVPKVSGRGHFGHRIAFAPMARACSSLRASDRSSPRRRTWAPTWARSCTSRSMGSPRRAIPSPRRVASPRKCGRWAIAIRWACNSMRRGGCGIWSTARPAATN